MTSESYGGHYMPNTAKYIVDHNDAAPPRIPFKGFMLGNPWTDPVANAFGRVETMYAERGQRRSPSYCHIGGGGS